MLTITAHGISPSVILALIEQMKEFGATVDRDTVTTSAGEMRFIHHEETRSLVIFVTRDRGHFPTAMLIGGIKQTVEEAAARFDCHPIFTVALGRGSGED